VFSVVVQFIIIPQSRGARSLSGLIFEIRP
jgi:hypothetical protein